MRGLEDSNSLTLWNAIYTRHQNEKAVAENLMRFDFEIFLPTYHITRQWSDRKKQVTLPLFPGYVFVRTNFERRLQVLKTPGVYSMVTFSGEAAVIPDNEIDGIRRAIDSKSRVQPHEFLRRGDWVRIKSGALSGVEGILVRKKAECRLVLSLERLGKAMSVEVDSSEIEPLPRKLQLHPPNHLV